MKVKFITLGCKVNQYETQALSERFKSYGCEVVGRGRSSAAPADLYVINTCSVTAKADSKSRELILKAKKENKLAKIAVVGCLPTHNKDYVAKLEVDYIVAHQDKQNLADIVFNQDKGDKNIWSLKINDFFNQRAFVKVQDGCDNFCSFCKVPHIRGRSISRAKKDIIEEIKRLSVNHREIVLCGINLGLWGRDFKDKLKLIDLVSEILSLKCLRRLRLSSLEPNLIGQGLVSLFNHPKMCQHVHLPFQSGDDKILKDMNKKETVDLYKALVRALRAINPMFAISCDIMVGFPHEEKSHFNNTYNFINEIKPMRTHIFTFSPREKTSLANIKPKNQKAVRANAAKLKDLAKELALNYQQQFIGKTLEMVAEERIAGYTVGYTENYLRVKVKQPLELGKIHPVKITQDKF